MDQTAQMPRKHKPRWGAVVVPRTDEELRSLLASYVANDDDAFEAVRAMSASDPGQCWRFLELARMSDLTDEQLGFVSAGPFEDMMKRHGSEFIDRVESAAQADDRMRFMLATAWRAGMSDALWGRLEALRVRYNIKRL